MQVDMEQAKVMEHLTAALSSARELRQDLLTYLIDMALTEALTAFTQQPKLTLGHKEHPGNAMGG